MFEVNNFRVAQLILRSGLTMEKFAQKAKLNQLTIRRMLKTGAKAKVATISALAQACNVDADSLILSSNEVKS